MPIRRVSSVVSMMSTPIVTMASTPREPAWARRRIRNSTSAPTSAAAAIPAASAAQKPASGCSRAMT